MERPEPLARGGRRPGVTASGLIGLLLTLGLLGCGATGRGVCLDGGRRCAAAQASPGLRSLRRGYRIHRYHWLRRTNRESGVPDVGLQAEWQPIRERR